MLPFTIPPSPHYGPPPITSLKTTTPLSPRLSSIPFTLPPTTSAKDIDAYADALKLVKVRAAALEEEEKTFAVYEAVEEEMRGLEKMKIIARTMMRPMTRRKVEEWGEWTEGMGFLESPVKPRNEVSWKQAQQNQYNQKFLKPPRDHGRATLKELKNGGNINNSKISLASTASANMAVIEEFTVQAKENNNHNHFDIPGEDNFKPANTINNPAVNHYNQDKGGENTNPKHFKLPRISGEKRKKLKPTGVKPTGKIGVLKHAVTRSLGDLKGRARMVAGGGKAVGDVYGDARRRGMQMRAVDLRKPNMGSL